jgi:hypothetical protein
MNKIIIIFIFLTCLILYFIFVLVFTNSYGNNKAKITNIDISTPLFTNFNITKCIGRYAKYKNIDIIDTYLEEPIKECEYIQNGDNTLHFQSNGEIMWNNMFATSGYLTSIDDYPARFNKNNELYNIVNNKNQVLQSTLLPTNDGYYTIGNRTFTKIQKIINVLSTNKDPILEDNEILQNDGFSMFISKGQLIISNGQRNFIIGYIENGKGPFKVILIDTSLYLQDSTGIEFKTRIDYLEKGISYKIKFDDTGKYLTPI